MDAGVLALLIPALAIATGLVAVLRLPRDELQASRERVDFTERLLAERPTHPSLPPGGGGAG